MKKAFILALIVATALVVVVAAGDLHSATTITNIRVDAPGAPSTWRTNLSFYCQRTGASTFIYSGSGDTYNASNWCPDSYQWSLNPLNEMDRDGYALKSYSATFRVVRYSDGRPPVIDQNVTLTYSPVVRSCAEEVLRAS